MARSKPIRLYYRDSDGTIATVTTADLGRPALNGLVYVYSPTAGTFFMSSSIVFATARELLLWEAMVKI